MSLTIRPLLSALRRSPTGAVLVTLQTAITLAVLANAAGIVGRRLEQLERPVGIDTHDTFAIGISSLSARFDGARAEGRDLAYLRTLPGVAAATVNIGIPLTGYGSSFRGFWRKPGRRGAFADANVVTTDNQFLRTVRVPLVAGRDFRANEVEWSKPHEPAQSPAELLVTRALARVLFPRGHALGETVYDAASDPLTIIGITRNFVGDRYQYQRHVYDTAVLPAPPAVFYTLLVRTRPGRRDAVMRTAQHHIGAAHRHAVIYTTITLAHAKRQFEANNRNMAVLLTTVTALMLAVCCLGIFGLTTFNVGSRTRQIGTRRAVGARKRDILTQFMMENSIILTAGTLLGILLALAIGAWLTAHFALPRLSLAYLLTGIAVLWVVGELAAWQPARRAANVPPSVATRTV
jgi:putative ABC transport system permease protein